jgi:hypothetical protein
MYNVRFQVLTSASMMVIVFRDAAPFRAIILMVEAASISETSVNFYQTKRRNITEDCRLYICSVHANMLF